MISVCLATYNGEKFIKEQLVSIINQLGPNDEIILSDDGSSDGTLAIVESLCDPRIKIVKNRGKHGFIGNFENALKASSGDVVFLSDQDDIWSDNKVKVSLDYLRNYDLIVHDAELIDSSGKKLGLNYFSTLHSSSGFLQNLLRTRCLGCCMVLNRNLLNACLPFPKHITGHDYWISTYALLHYKVKFLDEKLILYRRHGANASSSSEKSSNSLYYKIFVKRLGMIWSLLTH